MTKVGIFCIACMETAFEALTMGYFDYKLDASSTLCINSTILTPLLHRNHR
jgi:hypothetical protein